MSMGRSPIGTSRSGLFGEKQVPVQIATELIMSIGPYEGRRNAQKYGKQKCRREHIGSASLVQMRAFLCQIAIVRQELMLMAELSLQMKMVMGRACLSVSYDNTFEAVSENEMRSRMT
jgi:hypothetical protein